MDCDYHCRQKCYISNSVDLLVGLCPVVISSVQACCADVGLKLIFEIGYLIKLMPIELCNVLHIVMD
jgi:hypothetical protein